MFVVDASVVVAVFLENDPGHGAARRWLEEVALAGSRVVAPSVLLPEVASAIRRATADEGPARRAVHLLLSEPVISIAPLSEEMAVHAAEVAAAAGLRGTDAVYAGLAAGLGYRLVTLDREQLERAREVAETMEPGP